METPNTVGFIKHMFSINIQAFHSLCDVRFISDAKMFSTGWMIEDLSPGTGWEFFSSPLCPDQLWGSPNLLSDGYQGPFCLE